MHSAQYYVTVDDLQILYDYNAWANEKLFDVISQLTPAEYTKAVAGSYGSIRNTMVHVVSTEWGWLSRCGGRKRTGRLHPEDYATVESLIEEWNRVEVSMRNYLPELQDEDLARRIEYTGGDDKKCSMPLGELLQHTLNHAAHHRGQVAVLLRELGYDPGQFDLLFYFAEKRDVQPW